MNDIVIGIDLGTTNSCACVYLNDRLKILQNKEGGRTTPSFVFFTEHNAIVVGQYARKLAELKPEYGVYEIKRLVGRKFYDPYVQKNLNNLLFQVKNISNEPVIIIESKNTTIEKRPQDLCTCILRKIKADVEAKLGHSVDKAVITVPAYFSMAQREATLAAAKEAGFTVLKLLNEPTAAALSYYYENKCDTDNASFSLVYDLGGGTFDVAILRRKGSDIDIIGVDGDTHLGGHDFDNLLVEHVCQILITKCNYNAKNDRRNMRRLNNECEEAKKILSVVDETTIILNSLDNTHNTVEIPITREMFEKLVNPLLQKTIEIVDRCLNKASLLKENIQEVILCGGSTRIPKIETLLNEYFGNEKLNKFVNPDECVAEGAAIQAATLSKSSDQAISKIKITDVTALSLGTEDFVGAMTICIKRNTAIPTSSTINRITVYNNQTQASFNIYEGERLEASKNHFLGVLKITDLTPAPPGKCSISVTMSIDENGILTVSATETISNRTNDLKIAYARGKRNDSEVENVIVDATENKIEDERFCRFAEIKGYMINYCAKVMFNFEDKGLTLDYKEAYEKCADVIKVVKTLKVGDHLEVDRLKNEVVTLCSPIEKKFKFENMP